MTEDRHPHPMPGLITVFPLPRPEVQDNGPTEQQVDLGPLGVLTALVQKADTELAGGVVLETSDYGLPENVPEVPFGKGDTVFYPADHAIELNGFHLVAVTRVMAWLEPPK